VPRNWEEHYAVAGNLDFVPAPLLMEVAGMLSPGCALDLACGAGRNAFYLASLGWDVVAVDSSSSAIRILRERAGKEQLLIRACIADLETHAFPIEPAGFDLICDFFYLQRDLFPHIREGVRPGGMFVAEIHLRDAKAHRFVLEKGELRAEFSDWKILHYSEAARPGHGRTTAQIVARRT
jgi:SAM-dependent methyltransferase